MPEERLPRIPAWARDLAAPWPEMDVPEVPLDPAERAGSVRRARRLIREAHKHALGAEKLRPLLEAWDGLLAAERARLEELQTWDLVDVLRERAGLPVPSRTCTRAHGGDGPQKPLAKDDS